MGLLASLALAMRAEPVALLLDAERIAAGGQQYTAPGRLPLLLWLLSQAAQCVCCPLSALQLARGFLRLAQFMQSSRGLLQWF